MILALVSGPKQSKSELGAYWRASAGDLLQKFPNRRLHLSLSFFPKRARRRLATFRLGKVKVLSLPPTAVVGHLSVMIGPCRAAPAA